MSNKTTPRPNKSDEPRPGSAGQHHHRQGDHCSAQDEHGEELTVVLIRDDVKERIEEILAERLDIEEGRTGMVEAFPRVVAYEQLEVDGLVHQNRVRGVVGVLVDGRGEHDVVAHTHHDRGEQSDERSGQDRARRKRISRHPRGATVRNLPALPFPPRPRLSSFGVDASRHGSRFPSLSHGVSNVDAISGAPNTVFPAFRSLPMRLSRSRIAVPAASVLYIRRMVLPAS